MAKIPPVWRANEHRTIWDSRNAEAELTMSEHADPSPDERRRLMTQFHELASYVGWADADGARLAAAAELVEPRIPEMVEDFYDRIERHPGAKRVITGGAAQIERLKATLTVWIRELLSGRVDEAYVTRRWHVGWRHVEIGLDQVYTNAAMSRLRGFLVEALEAEWRGDRAELERTRAALHKRLDIDLALIQDAYQTELAERQRRLDRLAAIGQMAGGVAHELRQPLNVIKTSVYYLRHARAASPEKTRTHLERIDGQVALADGTIRALADFARLPAPEAQPVTPGELFDRALAAERVPEGVTVRRPGAGSPRVLADAEQIRIALGNVIRNACQAVGGDGELNLSVETDPESGRIALAVADNGRGLSAEQLERVTEPLYTSKARGIGLGLAITRAIVEKHGGELRAESTEGAGTRITLLLPPADTEQ